MPKRTFVGRGDEFAMLDQRLARVEERGRGELITLRGRRQVGKSTLLEVFLDRSDVPSCFFAAVRGAEPEQELIRFGDAIAESSLEAASAFEGLSFASWEAALRTVAEHTDHPSVLVLDELPYLVDGNPALEGQLQVAWDRALSRTPLLVVLVGSDLSVMDLIASHGRPLYGRVREMVLDPLTVGETALLLELDVPEVFDAYLVTGGFPRVLQEWPSKGSMKRFLTSQLRDSTSPLVVVGERIVNAEFPPPLQARDVLFAIGTGERTFTSIRDRAGVDEGSLTRTLKVLTEESRVVAATRPLSRKRSRDTRYAVADGYLRFWLRFVAPNMELILRGRGDVVAEQVLASWSEYRGKAIEPLVRESIERLLPDGRFGEAMFVGGYWTRKGDVDVDLVGATDARSPTAVPFVGSVKWRERAPFDRRDLLELATARERVPGASGARLVGVSRSGFATDELDVALGPEDLLRTWAIAPPVDRWGDLGAQGDQATRELMRRLDEEERDAGLEPW